MTLLNSKQLAAKLKRAPNYVSAMKAAGYQMKYGNRDTLANALAWLRGHPEFRTTGYCRGEVSAKRNHRKRLLPVNERRSDVRGLTHD